MAQNNNPSVGSIPTIYYDQVDDTWVRQSLKNLNDYFSTQNQFYGFNFFELVFTGAVTNQKYNHGLSYIPQDVSVLRISGAGAVTFNYGLFDTTTFDVTVSGPCRIRFFIGTYWNYKTGVQSSSTDVQTISPAPLTGATGATGASGAKGPAGSTGAQGPPGSGSSTVVAYVTNTYQMLTTDSVVEADGSASPFTVTLPPASTPGVFTVTKTDASANVITITVKNTATEYIGRSLVTTNALNVQGDSVQFVSMGTFWRILLAKKAPTLTKLTSGTNATYTTPLGVCYLRIRMVGGGGGGAGTGSSLAGNGGTGGTTLFGPSLLSATGGSGGASASAGQGVPSPTIGTAVGIAITGGGGNSGANNGATTGAAPGGGMGGVSAFGGAGYGGFGQTSLTPQAGGSAAANSGSGGGGAGGAATLSAGGGGAAGSYIDVLITAPLLTYLYTVGASGGGGTAGVSGNNGGAGAAGLIIIQEFYQ